MSLSLESIEAMKVADLKTACTNLGLPATGVKADLQARLKAHISAAPASSAAAAPAAVPAAAPAAPAAAAAAPVPVAAAPAPAPAPAAAAAVPRPAAPVVAGVPISTTIVLGSVSSLSAEDKLASRAAKFGTAVAEPGASGVKRKADEDPAAALARRQAKFGVAPAAGSGGADASLADKVAQRAQRFGNQAPLPPSVLGLPSQEELERRKKRAEKFGLPAQ